MRSLTLFAIGALSSCAAMTAKPSAPLEVGHLSGTGSAEQFETIKKGLTRSASAGYTNYFVEAYPVTDPLIEAEEKKRGKENLSSDEEIRKAIADHKRNYTANKTCFMVLVSMGNASIEAAQFKYWVAKLRGNDQQLHTLEFSEASLRSVPSGSVSSGGGIVSTTWINAGSACVGKRIDLSSGAELVLIPQMVPDHMKSQISLKWLAPTKETKTVSM
jgi:hypothetical protein